MTTAWTPHEYQMKALHSMVGLPGYGMFAEPGLGKTSTTLAAYSVLKDNGAAQGHARGRPAAPLLQGVADRNRQVGRLRGHDLRRAARRRRRSRAWLGPQKDVYVINYEGLQWLEKSLAGKADALRRAVPR